MDELDKSNDDDSHSLNAENLQKFNHEKCEIPTKASLLSDDKMKSIMAFLDEVQVSERLSTVDQVSLTMRNVRFPPRQACCQMIK